MMLDADVQTGIVVDRNGAVQGLLTLETVADKMRVGEHVPALMPDHEGEAPSDVEAAAFGEGDTTAEAETMSEADVRSADVRT